MTFSKVSMFLLLVLISLSGLGQIPFQEENIDYKYNIDGALHIKHQLYKEVDSVLIILSILPNEDTPTNWNTGYSLNVNFKKDYQSTEILHTQSVDIGESLAGKNGNESIFVFRIKRFDDSELAVIDLKHNTWQDDFLYDINMKEDLDYGHSGLVLYNHRSNIPIVDPYIKSNTSILVKHLSGEIKKIWLYYYSTEFDVALPPMIVDTDNINRSLTVTSTTQTTTDTVLTLKKQGLYFIQTDTNSLEGIAFRIENDPFPKCGTYDQLIQPIRYISTKTENEQIEKESDLKKSFETFWITTNASPLVAQNSIKEYYYRVAAANLLFTSYKEGWKTDMGMVYIIYGPPDKVYKHEEYEQWIFNQNVNMPAIRFTFVKIKNVFSTNHFSLVRDRKFDKHWFRAVELWRKGKR